MDRTAFGLLLGLLGMLLCASGAHAQSCCSVASDEDLAVVPPQQRAVVTARLSAKPMLFLHDREGRSHALGEDVSATDLQLGVGGGLRLPFYDRLQLHGAMPLRVQLRSLPASDGSGGADSATAVGPGDASAFLRWSPVFDDERGFCDDDAKLWPALDLFAGASLPTGRYEDGPRARDLARTMGEGSAAVQAGARALKYVTRTQGVRLAARYAHRFARTGEDAGSGYESFALGDQVGVTLGWWMVDGMRWLFGATLETTWTFASRAQAAGGSTRSLPGTEMRQTSLGLQVTRMLRMPELDLTFGLGADLPLPGVSSNVSWEGISAGLALRYHFVDGQ